MNAVPVHSFKTLSFEQSPWQALKHRPPPTRTSTLYSPMWNSYSPPMRTGLTSRTWPYEGEFKIRPLNEDIVCSPLPSSQFSIACLTKVPIRPQNERATGGIHSGAQESHSFSDGAAIRSALVSPFCTRAEFDSNGRAHSGAIMEFGDKCISQWDSR